MESIQFDRLVHRLMLTGSRRGVVTMLAAAGLGIEWSRAQDGAATKKGKKRCRTLAQSHQTGTKKKHCCKGLTCDTVGASSVRRCCLQTQQRCGTTGSEFGECCGDRVCFGVDGLEGFHCCAPIGAACDENNDCCTQAVCNQAKQCELP